MHKDKIKLRSLAEDLNMQAKVLVAILSKYCETPKNSSHILTLSELNLIFAAILQDKIPTPKASSSKNTSIRIASDAESNADELPNNRWDILAQSLTAGKWENSLRSELELCVFRDVLGTYSQQEKLLIQCLYELYRLENNRNGIENIFRLHPLSKQFCLLSKETVICLCILKRYTDAMQAYDYLSFLGMVDPKNYHEALQMTVIDHAEMPVAAAKLNSLVAGHILLDSQMFYNEISEYAKEVIENGTISTAIGVMLALRLYTHRKILAFPLMLLYLAVENEDEAEKECTHIQKSLTETPAMPERDFIALLSIEYEQKLSAWKAGRRRPSKEEKGAISADSESHTGEGQTQNSGTAKKGDGQVNEGEYLCGNPSCLLSHTNRMNKALQTFFSYSKADLKQIRASKAELAPYVIGLYYKFKLLFHSDPFTISDCETFRKVFPMYGLHDISDDDIKQLGELLDNIYCVLTHIKPIIELSYFQVSGLVCEILMQKESISDGRVEKPFIAVTASTKQLTTNGLLLLISTLQTEAENRQFWKEITGGDAELYDTFNCQLFGTIPNALPARTEGLAFSPAETELENAFHIECLYRSLIGFTLSIESCAVRKIGGYMPNAYANRASTEDFYQLINVNYSYSSELCQAICWLYDVWKQGLRIGDTLHGIKITLCSIDEQFRRCIALSEEQHKELFEVSSTQYVNALFTYKYYPVLHVFDEQEDGLKSESDKRTTPFQIQEILDDLHFIHTHLFTELDECTLCESGHLPQLLPMTHGLSAQGRKAPPETEEMEWLSLTVFHVDNQREVLYVDGEVYPSGDVVADTLLDFRNITAVSLASGLTSSGWEIYKSIESNYMEILWKKAIFSEPQVSQNP